MKITLKAARVNAGLSQSEAAEKLGISMSTMNNYEKGATFPDVPTIKKMEEVYGIGYDDIIFLVKKNS